MEAYGGGGAFGGGGHMVGGLVVGFQIKNTTKNPLLGSQLNQAEHQYSLFRFDPCVFCGGVGELLGCLKVVLAIATFTKKINK